VSVGFAVTIPNESQRPHDSIVIKRRAGRPVIDQAEAREDASARAAYEEARGHHVGVNASFATFRERWRSLESESAALTPERAADIYLACACQEGDSAGLRWFEIKLLPGVRAAVARLVRSPDAVDDTVQELLQRLFCGPKPKICGYAGRGPLWKWLRIMSVRIAGELRHARGLAPTVSPDVVEKILQEEVPRETLLVQKRYAGTIRQALTRAIEALPADDKALLRLQYLERQGIDRLAALFRAHRATMARRLQQIRRRIATDVRAQIGAHLPNLSADEAKSLWRALRSQVHLSLSRLIGRTSSDR
jgi:RNA polymerase sigma-70 factor, ECF subfamily